MADPIAWTHHERLDGNGYLPGLKGAEIPLPGQIAALADVFDALTSDRPSRPAFRRQDALELVEQDRGVKFDGRVVDALVTALAS